MPEKKDQPTPLERFKKGRNIFLAGVGTGVIGTVVILATRSPRIIDITPEQIQTMIEDPEIMALSKQIAIGRFGAAILPN